MAIQHTTYMENGQHSTCNTHSQHSYIIKNQYTEKMRERKRESKKEQKRDQKMILIHKKR